MKFWSSKGICEVSIHAPWEGCDARILPCVAMSPCFNSRTLGRVRLKRAKCRLLDDVSIHAPWEGCDPLSEEELEEVQTFQFTHPGKGAT